MIIKIKNEMMREETTLDLSLTRDQVIDVYEGNKEKLECDLTASLDAAIGGEDATIWVDATNRINACLAEAAITSYLKAAARKSR